MDITIGERIKRLRNNHSLTQKNVANSLCVTPQAVSRWENNETTPDVDLLAKLANIFSVSIDFLLTGKDFAAQEKPSEKVSEKPAAENLFNAGSVLYLGDDGIIRQLNEHYSLKLKELKQKKIDALFKNSFFYALLGLVCLLFLSAYLFSGELKQRGIVPVFVILYFLLLTPFLFFLNKEILLRKLIDKNPEKIQTQDFLMQIFWSFIAIFLSPVLFAFYLYKYINTFIKLKSKEKSLEINKKKEGIV